MSNSINIEIFRDKSGEISGYAVKYWKERSSKKSSDTIAPSNEVSLMATSRRHLATQVNAALDDLEGK